MEQNQNSSPQNVGSEEEQNVQSDNNPKGQINMDNMEHIDELNPSQNNEGIDENMPDNLGGQYIGNEEEENYNPKRTTKRI